MKIYVLTTVLFIGIFDFVSSFKRVCYYGSWTNHLQSMEARFQISDIDPFLCTHIVFAFAKVDTDGLKLNKQQPDDDNGQYHPNAAGKFYDFTNLKHKNPKLKTLLSIGGQTTSESFHKVAENEGRRLTFAKNCLTFLRDRNFDGLDIDWEYPRAFKNDFTALLQVMQQVFELDAQKTGKPRLILSIAGAAGKGDIDMSYDVASIIKYVDFINVMTYDYYGPTWSHVTGFTGALYSSSTNLSQNWTIHYWIQKGAPIDKLVMGTTATALSFTLLDTNQHGVGAPINFNRSFAGPYTKTPGHLAYYEVCRKGRKNWDDESKSSYIYSGKEWYGFSDKQSMIEKVKYAKAMGLDGVMFWIMDRDDFSGKYCGEGKFPLLNALATAAENRNFTKAPTTIRLTTPTKANTTPSKTQVVPINNLHENETDSSNSTETETTNFSGSPQGEQTTAASTIVTTTLRATRRPAFIVYNINISPRLNVSKFLIYTTLIISVYNIFVRL